MGGSRRRFLLLFPEKRSQLKRGIILVKLLILSQFYVNQMLINYIIYVNYHLNMDLELINWVKDGKYRIRTLELLSSQPLLSSELANKMDINRASMSRILKSLKERGLVESISNNSRTVTYTLTDKGSQLFKKIKGSKR